MQIDERVLERVVHLKDSQGMGFRRIARQLKKEGLANVSKSTVATLYNRYASKLRAKTDGKLKHDKEWLSLVEVESRFAAKVEEAKRKAEQYERVRKLAFLLASTSYGRAQIFNNPTTLREWCEVALRNQTSPTLLDQLRRACEEDETPFEKTLWEIVGGSQYPQYYESILRREGLHLDKFVREEVEYYVHDRGKERRQEKLQKQFSKSLVNARCSECGKPICSSMAHLGYPNAYTFLMIEDQLRCYHCNTPFRAICPGCGQPLDCDGQSFCCRNCDLKFFLQNLEVSTRKLVDTTRANILS